jgi:hypothetical protein
VHVDAGCTLDWGLANFDADPRFLAGPFGNFYLDQAPGEVSPCVDQGRDQAASICFATVVGEVCLSALTTRIDSLADEGVADLGFHYPREAGSPTPTPSPTPTATRTPTATTPLTPTLIEIKLTMPAHAFHAGDACGLDLRYSNPGAARTVDLYVLFDVFGTYFAYPSWSEVQNVIDYDTIEVGERTGETLTLIPEFTMPAVPPAGPLYFFAALFEQGTLDLEHLASNGVTWSFSLE